MNLLGSGASASTSKCALEQSKSWDQMLKVRISLQRSVELTNELPISESPVCEEQVVCSNLLKRTLQSLYESTGSTIHDVSFNKKSKSNKISIQNNNFEELGVDSIWNELSNQQNSMKNQWVDVIDKWNARLNFGNEQAKAKLKILNYSMWDQINDVLTDEDKMLEKSRMPFEDSKRMNKQDNEEDSECYDPESSSSKYDKEVYDDRNFYSLLLKSYINDNNSGDQFLTAEDIAELKKYKKNQHSKVDRKASKGRKIRYVPHTKLQNFMFPMGVTKKEELLIDSDRLFASLFQ